MLYKTLLTVIISCALVSSCSLKKINLNSYSHPDFINKKYESVAVYYESENFDYRSDVESSFVEELRDGEVQAVQGSILFPPLEEWSDNYKQQKLKEKGIGALIVFELDSVQPIKVVDGTENEIYPFKVSEKGYEDEEDRINKTHYTMSIMLIDVESNTIAWQGKFDPFYLKFLDKDGRKSNTKNMARGILKELEAKGHIVLD
ncbi:MAG: hypothetical protein ACE364_07465 [Chlorobiota bacterium]